MSFDYTLLLLPCLFLTALLYASVGHGGASGYIALMKLFEFSKEFIRPAALTLNLFVSILSFIQYTRKGHFRLNLFWPFAVASVPASFAGALIEVDATWYNRILAVFLIVSVIRLIGFSGRDPDYIRPLPLWAALLTGAVIGVLSGMIGIGGGILLSPIILLFRWGTIKETAAVSALFIFVNSLAGLVPLFYKGIDWLPEMIAWVPVVIAGGILGGYLGGARWPAGVVRLVLAGVLIFATIKLVIT